MATNMAEQGIVIVKTVSVRTNDPHHSKILLKISGKVQKVVSIIPDRILFTGRVGQPLSQTVTITQEPHYAFKVTGLSALEGYNIKYHIAEKKVNGKVVYKLTVTNAKNTPGRYFDRIFIKTDNKVVGTIPIMVSGYLISPTRKMN